MLHVLSTVVLVLIGLGVYHRKNTRLHFRYMLGAFLLDLSLVLWIEFSRHATGKVSEGGLHGILLVHVVASVITLGLYIFQLAIGSSLLRGRKFSRQTHMRAGLCFIFFRLVNYVTAFMVVP